MLNAQNNTNAYFAGPDSTANLEWLFDSGATNHFTTDKSIFNNNTKYHGGEKLVIGDGQVLRIFNMRSLHVPHKKKNIQFCQPYIKK